MKYKDLSTDSLIRLFNYEENDNGFGEQFIRNNDEEIWDMQENFGWNNSIPESYVGITWEIPIFLLCSKKGITMHTEEDVRNTCISYLNNCGTPSGELQEIIEEEMYNTIYKQIDDEMEMISNEFKVQIKYEDLEFINKENFW